MGVGVEGGEVWAEAGGEDLHQESVPEAGDGNGASALWERAVLVGLWDGGEERIPEGGWASGARVLVSAVSTDGARAGWWSRERMTEALMPKGPTTVSRSAVVVVRTYAAVRDAESMVRAAWESAW